jgi:hypothetical protein
MHKYILRILKPHMRVKRVIDHDIVIHNTIKTFSQLKSSIQAKVIVDFIV